LSFAAISKFSQVHKECGDSFKVTAMNVKSMSARNNQIYMPQVMQNLNTSGHNTLTRMPCRFNGASDLVNITTPPTKMKFEVI